jgi:hypothetical protein
MAGNATKGKKAQPKRTSPSRNGHAPTKSTRPSPELIRETFRTSREMDFFSEKELIGQTGHPVKEWPFVIIKELLDNALDACDEANVSPEIEVIADAVSITVRDNGPGLPERTLKAALDFTVRASSREAYVAPDRGAQGNALMTLLAMPRVIDPIAGKLVVKAGGRRHEITCGADPISQRAVIKDEVANIPKSKKTRSREGQINQGLSLGTEVRIEWGPASDDGEVVWPFSGQKPQDEFDDLLERLPMLVEGFALFNPHATIRVDYFGRISEWGATNPSWKKWRPNDPTSSHWYELRHLERLIGAYVTSDGDAKTDRLVSDFLAEFDGLSGSVKRTKVLDEAGLKRANLSDLIIDGQFDSKRIADLLTAMQRHSRPVRSARLGVIGEEHLRERLLKMGVKPESFRYAASLAKPDDQSGSFMPSVVEVAFGYRGDDEEIHRRIYTGANWSAAIGNPFRSFGGTGEGLETVLADMRATRDEPIVYVAHLAHPRLEYRDRGKSAIIVGGD